MLTTTTTALLSALGLLVSAYGYFVEKKMEHDVTYKPFCDISDAISCSKPFKSMYGKTFGISNTILGLMFYSFMLVLSALDARMALFYGALGAAVATVYFAYILYVKVRSFCLVCTTMYVINIALLIASMHLM